MAFLHSKLNGILFYLTVFTIVFLHEFGHIFEARKYGISCKEVVFSIFGGAAMIQSNPKNAKEEWRVGIAGIRVNMYLIILGLIALIFAEKLAYFKAMDLISTFLIINVALVVFNLLPIYPMDGGRVLKSIFWRFMSLKKAMKLVNITAMVGAIIMSVVFILLKNYFGALVMGMVLLMNFSEARATDSKE
jgi:Zn-dependent protease